MVHFYENEIENDLLSIIQEKYNLKSTEHSFDFLYLRYYLLYKKECFEKDFVDMLLDLLHIDKTSNKFTYKETDVYFYQLQIIFSNYLHTRKMSSIGYLGKKLNWQAYIDEVLHIATQKGIKQSIPYKKNKHYSSFKTYFIIKEIESFFDVTYSTFKFPSYIKYTTINEIPLTFEEKQLQLIESIHFETTELIGLSEKDIEDFLVKNLNKLEPNLVYIDRQVKIEEGFLDILARDQNGEYVIIEVKICDDERLIWQCIYYPRQFKKEYHTNIVRMMTVAPYYGYKIKQALDEIGMKEVFQFTPLIKNGKLVDLSIQKIKGGLYQ